MGAIYDPLPPELAAGVPGYKPWTAQKSAGFWVRRDCEEEITIGKGDAEFSTMTNLDRFEDLTEVVADLLAGW